jgi:hypothetical protein
VNQVVPLDDQRGVDVAQLRALLLPNPAERIAHMVVVAKRSANRTKGMRAGLLFN